MALPVVTKTWQFNVNNSIPAQGSNLLTMRRVMRLLVNALVGFALAPWTVRGSSDSVAAAMDATNRWVADTNLVWAGAGVHSWIVLRQTGISATFEVCIDLFSSTPGNATILVSTVGFTGGTTSARPTATDEVALITGQQWCDNLDIGHVLDVWQSTDGQCTRVAILSQSTNLVGFFLFDRPLDPVTGWTNPWVATVRGIASGACFTLATHYAQAACNGRRTTTMSLYLTAEAYNSSAVPLTTAIGNVVNEISNEWDLPAMGIVCITSGNRGRHGGLADIWWKPEGIAHGDTGPNDISRQFLALGGMFLPWNGTVAVLA